MKISNAILAALFLTFIFYTEYAISDDKHSHSHHRHHGDSHAHHTHSNKDREIGATVTLKFDPPKFDLSSEVVKARGTLIDKAGRILGPRDLRVVHTERLHLLMVHESLEDYHHIHPTLTDNGFFDIQFKPMYSGEYRIWADIVPRSTGVQEYVPFKLKIIGNKNARYSPRFSEIVSIDSYRFTFQWLNEMLRIQIARAGGKPVLDLEPIMGTFGHLVGFSQALMEPIHAHPEGKEPLLASDRGGPTLDFHIGELGNGTYRFYLQVRISGQELYVPYDLNIS